MTHIDRAIDLSGLLPRISREVARCRILAVACSSPLPSSHPTVRPPIPCRVRTPMSERAREPPTTISFHAIEREILRRRREREREARERSPKSVGRKKSSARNPGFIPLGRFRMSNAHFYVAEPCPIPMCTCFGMSSCSAIYLV